MELPHRLADILAQHLTTMGELSRPVIRGASHERRERFSRRVLLPADQQRACVPPRIAALTTASDGTGQLGSS
jgi:hypothetical protein